MTDGLNMISRFNNHLTDVYCMKRDDVEALATLDSHTLPEELPEASYEQQAAFFEETKHFLDERYGSLR